MSALRNIYRDHVSGAWVVEFRRAGDDSWTRVYVGGSEHEALRKYRALAGKP